MKEDLKINLNLALEEGKLNKKSKK